MFRNLLCFFLLSSLFVLVGCEWIKEKLPLNDDVEQESCKVFSIAKRGKITSKKGEKVRTCYIPNQLILDTSITPENEEYLKKMGFKLKKDCKCSKGLKLFEHTKENNPDLIGVIGNAVKKPKAVGDGTGLSLNVTMDLAPIEVEKVKDGKGDEDLIPRIPLEINPKDNPKIIVGIIDSGTDTSHPNLKPFYLEKHPNSNCKGMYASGTDITDFGNAPKDYISHGTYVGGIIAGQSIPVEIVNDALKTNIKLLNAKVTEKNSTQLTLFDAVCGMHYAMENNARVLNLSFAYLDTIAPDIMVPVLEKALKNNVILIAGAGNDTLLLDTSSLRPFPAALSNVDSLGDCIISVGAYDNSNGDIAVFSNRGIAVDLYAPGVNIITTGLASSEPYAYVIGTSFATPFVSRVAAGIIDRKPNMPVVDVKQLILSTTTNQNYLNAQSTLSHPSVQ